MLWRKINCVIRKKKKMKNKLKLKIEIECYCILELVSNRKKLKDRKLKQMDYGCKIRCRNKKNKKLGIRKWIN